MMPLSHEYEIVWTGTMEAEATRAQQIPPEPRPATRAGTTMDAVLRFITAHPGSSMREIAFGTGLDRSVIEDASYTLNRRNVIERTNPPSLNRRVPIRWRVR